MSMFGGFGGIVSMKGPRLGQPAGQGVTPVGSTLFGGFPGIYPAMGPGQSGAAGILEFRKRIERCVRSGECPVTYGPPAMWI